MPPSRGAQGGAAGSVRKQSKGEAWPRALPVSFALLWEGQGRAGEEAQDWLV